MTESEHCARCKCHLMKQGTALRALLSAAERAELAGLVLQQPYTLRCVQVAELRAEEGTELHAQLSAAERAELAALGPQLKRLQVL